jgi:hypothetical protein
MKYKKLIVNYFLTLTLTPGLGEVGFLLSFSLVHFD